MRITTTVSDCSDTYLIDFCNNCLISFISFKNKECAYKYNDMEVWIVRKKNGNISVKGYRK